MDWLQRTVQLNYRVVALGPDGQSIILAVIGWGFFRQAALYHSGLCSRLYVGDLRKGITPITSRQAFGQ